LNYPERLSIGTNLSEPIKNSRLADPNQYFCTEHLKTDLKGRSVRGGAVTMITQAGKFILNMGSTVILARLLTPQDYGLIGMVTAVTGLVALFNDMGLSTATIQRAEINHNHRVVCIDKLEFRPDGTIAPVTLTHEGVPAHPVG